MTPLVELAVPLAQLYTDVALTPGWGEGQSDVGCVKSWASLLHRFHSVYMLLQPQIGKPKRLKKLSLNQYSSTLMLVPHRGVALYEAAGKRVYNMGSPKQLPKTPAHPPVSGSASPFGQVVEPL